jgi:hypothetical protein
MEDGQHDFFLRVASSHPLYFISKTLSYKKEHQFNLSNKPRVSALINYSISLLKLLNDNKITIKEYTKISSLNNYKIAKLYFENNDPIKSIKYQNKVFKQSTIFSKIYLKTLVFKLFNT